MLHERHVPRVNTGGIPLGLVATNRQWPVLWGWMLIVAGAVGFVAGLLQRAPVFIVVGPIVCAAGVYLARRTIAKRFPAYGLRRRR